MAASSRGYKGTPLLRCELDVDLVDVVLTCNLPGDTKLRKIGLAGPPVLKSGHAFAILTFLDMEPWLGIEYVLDQKSTKL